MSNIIKSSTIKTCTWYQIKIRNLTLYLSSILYGKYNQNTYLSLSLSRILCIEYQEIRFYLSYKWFIEI